MDAWVCNVCGHGNLGNWDRCAHCGSPRALSMGFRRKKNYRSPLDNITATVAMRSKKTTKKKQKKKIKIKLI